MIILLFCFLILGRLAEYRYYSMDQVIQQAFNHLKNNIQ